jgi:hypothetical protein
VALRTTLGGLIAAIIASLSTPASAVDGFVTAEGTSKRFGRGDAHRFVVEVERSLSRHPRYAAMFGRPMERLLFERRFAVEVERLPKRPVQWYAAQFARHVEDVLFDSRSWIGSGRVALRRVHHGSYAFRITLATRETTDALCAPMLTVGLYSCFNNGRVVVNAWRWREGATSYGKQLRRYRSYLVNHEVGHALGLPHTTCSTVGRRAPVMMQQTKGTGTCLAHPWPLEWERGVLP